MRFSTVVDKRVGGKSYLFCHGLILGSQRWREVSIASTCGGHVWGWSMSHQTDRQFCARAVDCVWPLVSVCVCAVARDGDG